MAVLATGGLTAGTNGQAPPVAPPSIPLPAPQTSPSPSGETGGLRPVTARRAVAMFDFEEHRPDAAGEINPERIPRYWDPIHVVPGFPDWNEIAFDRVNPAHSGETSVRLPTRGGSARLRMQPGAIPVFPRGDYLVTAFVRTERLRHARAFVAARFLDQDRRPIDTPPAAAEVRSQPIVSPGDWTPVTLSLRGESDRVAFLQIDLDLLQPDQFRAARSPHDLDFEDVDGAAWFDDVGVYLVPRTELSTTGPANVFLAPERPVLRYFVRDLVGDALTASLRITDADGAVAATSSAPADPNGRVAEWCPDLPAFGWYAATLDVVHDGLVVARSRTEFLLLPPLPASRPPRAPDDLRALGLAADRPADTGDPWPAFLPRLAPRLTTGFMVLPLARAPADPADGRLPGRSAVLEALLQQRQDLTISMDGPPTGIGVPPAAPASPDPEWIVPWLSFLDAYGQRITRWQLGPTGGDRLFWDRLVPGAPAEFRAGVARYVPGAAIVIPWRAELARPALPDSTPSAPGPVQGVSLAIPDTFPPSVIPSIVREWQDAPSGATDLTVVLEVPDAESYGRRAAADELVKRAAMLWSAAPIDTPAAEMLPRVAIDRPWRVTAEPRAEVLPGPHLAALRTIADHFAGRRFITWLPVAPGVRCAVLADLAPREGPERGRVHGTPSGAIVAWNESAPPEAAVLRGYLGDRAMTRVDVFGNAAPVVPEAGPGRACAVPIPSSPVIIEGVEPQIARLIASFRIEPPFARAAITEHSHALIIENPWPVRITGRLQVIDPADGERGWRISPAGVVNLSIAPGATERVPFTFSFSPGEEAGVKTVTVRVQLNADHPLPAIDLRAPLEIGLPDIDFVPDLIVGRARNGKAAAPDVAVVATVTNRGSRARTLRLEVFAPGFPSQEQTVSDLAPGESVRRRFIFRGAAAALAGRRILCSAGDIDAPERLNRSVRVP